jgi:glycosyltransferase 2 family protein
VEPLEDTSAQAARDESLGPPGGRRLWPAWWAVVLALAAAAAVATVLMVDVTAAPSPARVRLAADDSVESFRRAVEALGDRVAAIGWWALAAGVAFAIANSAARTRAWRNILMAAYPDATVRWWDTFRAYYAGVGLNSVVPARAGDVLKLFLMKRRVRDSSYPALASSLLAESIFDAMIAIGLIVWAWQLGILPGLPSLPELPAFELSWYAERPWILAIIGAVLVVALIWAGLRVRAFWAHVKQGLVILTMPGTYLRRVVLVQAVAWCMRVASAYWFLAAFNVPATLENALLVQVAVAVGTLLPATPGGLGPKQAMILILLAGSASRVDLLAFSVGIEVVMLAVNVVLGVVCAASMIGSLRVGAAVRAARREAGGRTGDAEG